MQIHKLQACKIEVCPHEIRTEGSLNYNGCRLLRTPRALAAAQPTTARLQAAKDAGAPN